ncbi:MAG: hypothetical protein ACM3S1_16450 [Hyphomicrobiales bacterium]
MRFFRRERAPASPGFGEWVLRSFERGQQLDALPFARVEQVCSNAASLLCAAALARGETAAALVELDGESLAEADLIARRTADAFRAALDDPEHSVLAWPWDHMATRAAWQASRSGATTRAVLGRQLQLLATAYALHHADQLARVIDIWESVAAGLPGDGRPDLTAMGAAALDAYMASHP